MRIETLWQGEQREARMHWWQQVLEGPSVVNRDDLFDEMLCHRFRAGAESDPKPRTDDRGSLFGCWA